MPKILPIALLICLIEVSSAAVLILNPSFESSDMSPWTRTAISGIRPWSRGSATAQDGSWFIFTVNEASISQSFSPILGGEVNEFTFWVDRPTTANMFIELSYQDGSSSGRVNINGDTSPGWGMYDALPLVGPSKQLTGFSIIKTGTGTARLDNFKLLTVPEVSTIGLCIPGFALILRRKRQSRDAPTGHKLFSSFHHPCNRAGERTSNVVPKMNRLAYICCLLCVLPLVTHCENEQSTHANRKTMNSTDSDYTLVMSVFDKTNEQIREKGWDNVGVEHRHLANVIAFYSKVENSGFGGFYFDSEHLPDMIEELSGSLKEVGALRAERLLQASTLKFEGGVVPAGMDARIAIAQSYPEDFDPFEDLDNNFYSEAEPDMALLANYIRANPSAFK